MNVIALLLAVSSLFAASPAPVLRTKDETRILETVFRYQIAYCYPSAGKTSYSLSYKDHDPPDTLMERFRNQSVSKASEANASKDKLNRSRFIELSVDAIERVASRRATASGSCINDPEGASFLYTLRMTHGKWVVTHARMVGAS